MSSAVNVLTKILTTFHVTKSDFSNSITFTVINKCGKGAGAKIESVFWPVSMSPVEGSSQTGAFTVINQYGKGAGVEIESVFRPFYHNACRRVLSNGSF